MAKNHPSDPSVAKSDRKQQTPDIAWLEADSPWGIRVLDVRPITITMLATSPDPKCAESAMSFGQDDGASFIGEKLHVSRITAPAAIAVRGQPFVG